jgi:hypothetical protein
MSTSIARLRHARESQSRDRLATLSTEWRFGSFTEVFVSLSVSPSFVITAFVHFNASSVQPRLRTVFEASRISITVVKRADKQITGFIVLPKDGS